MVECELDQVAQKWLSSSQIYEYIVININIFNVENHAIIEIIERGSVLAQKWSCASWIFLFLELCGSNHCPNFLIQPNHI